MSPLSETTFELNNNNNNNNNNNSMYKYKIIDSSMCPCKTWEQTTDHILYDCELVKQERDN
jgi:hypothetical protein